MNTMLESLFEYFPAVVEINELTGWKTLKSLPLSQTLRAQKSSGESVIVKIGPKETADEANKYKELVFPLAGHFSPIVYQSFSYKNMGLLILEDLNETDIEKDYNDLDFIEAAKFLGRIRQTSSNKIKEGKMEADFFHKHTVTAEDLINQLHLLLGNACFFSHEMSSAFKRALNILPKHLNHLYSTSLLFLNHNTFSLKSILYSNDRMIINDWANASLSPYLGDLFSLLRESNERTACEIVLESYCSELEEPPEKKQLEWLLALGGIYWFIQLFTSLGYSHESTKTLHKDDIPILLNEFQELADYLETIPLPA